MKVIIPVTLAFFLLAGFSTGCKNNEAGPAASAGSAPAAAPVTAPAAAQPEIQRGIQQGQAMGAAYAERQKAHAGQQGPK